MVKAIWSYDPGIDSVDTICVFKGTSTLRMVMMVHSLTGSTDSAARSIKKALKVFDSRFGRNWVSWNSTMNADPANDNNSDGNGYVKTGALKGTCHFLDKLTMALIFARTKPKSESDFEAEDAFFCEAYGGANFSFKYIGDGNMITIVQKSCCDGWRLIVSYSVPKVKHAIVNGGNDLNGLEDIFVLKEKVQFFNKDGRKDLGLQKFYKCGCVTSPNSSLVDIVAEPKWFLEGDSWRNWKFLVLKMMVMVLKRTLKEDKLKLSIKPNLVSYYIVIDVSCQLRSFVYGLPLLAEIYEKDILFSVDHKSFWNEYFYRLHTKDLAKYRGAKQVCIIFGEEVVDLNCDFVYWSMHLRTIMVKVQLLHPSYVAFKRNGATGLGNKVLIKNNTHSLKALKCKTATSAVLLQSPYLCPFDQSDLLSHLPMVLLVTCTNAKNPYRLYLDYLHGPFPCFDLADNVVFYGKGNVMIRHPMIGDTQRDRSQMMHNSKAQCKMTYHVVTE